MDRPLRFAFAGAVYHVTSCGNRRENFLHDDDRYDWLEVLSSTFMRFNWTVHAFCQMGNHYHLLLETAGSNLSRGIRQLNGHYTQLFNRHHGLWWATFFKGAIKRYLYRRKPIC